MTNLLSRFRSLFRKAEPEYDYDEYGEAYEEPYEAYPDAVEEPSGFEPAVEEPLPTATTSGEDLRMPQGASSPSAEPAGQGIHVALSPIIGNMPLELRSRVLHEVANVSVFFPLERILPQLASGAVWISFGELREAAPNVFSPNRDQDEVLVDVPLSAILPQISPDMLARRHGPLQMDIPDDIVSPFADKGRGLAIGSLQHQAPAPPKPPARPAPTAPVHPLGSAPMRPAPPAPAGPRNPAFPFPGVAQTPAVPQQAPKAAPPVPTPLKANLPAPDTLRPGGSATAKPKLPMPPVAPQAPTSQGGTGLPRKPLPQLPAAQPAVPAPAQPSTPAGQAISAPLSVPLSQVAGAWPDALKQEIVQYRIADASLAIPFDVVEAGLKRGQLRFTWAKLKSWLQAGSSPAASVHDHTEVELPLRVVAPLFISQKQRRPAQAPKVAVDKDIPNLFFGLPQPDTAGLAVDHAVNRPVDTNYYVWDDQADTVPDDARNDAARHARTAGTEFVTRYATPNEVVSRAAGLDGVEGAVIALPDGLMVASQLPAGLNGDTLAAFLPQLFGKVTQCTQELRMGELNNLNFTVGNVPWKIFRVNALYFAAFGQKGQALPTARLAGLAAELDHKAKV